MSPTLCCRSQWLRADTRLRPNTAGKFWRPLVDFKRTIRRNNVLEFPYVHNSNDLNIENRWVTKARILCLCSCWLRRHENLSFAIEYGIFLRRGNIFQYRFRVFIRWSVLGQKIEVENLVTLIQKKIVDTANDFLIICIQVLTKHNLIFFLGSTHLSNKMILKNIMYLQYF